MKEKYKVKEMWVKKDSISGEIVDRHMSRYDTYSEALYDVSWYVLYYNSNYSFNRPAYKWNIGIWGWN